MLPSNMNTSQDMSDVECTLNIQLDIDFWPIPPAAPWTYARTLLTL